MKIREYENLIIEKLKIVVDKIIEDNPNLTISAKARAGAEISDWIEEQFVEYTKKHQYFEDSESAPKASTKNPWDARTIFKLDGIKEELWIDFKSFKDTSVNSNPDIGTPNKIVKLINDGNFYHVFIYIFYQATDTGLEFVKLNDSLSKLYFLKDISSTFRRNPKNQLQVNISELPKYRTREEFINILINKIKESHVRQMEISTKASGNIDQIENELLKSNEKSEKETIKKLK